MQIKVLLSGNNCATFWFNYYRVKLTKNPNNFPRWLDRSYPMI